MGKVTKTDKSGTTEESEVVDEVVSTEPMANVGFRLSHTKNLGNYESLKVDVSLYMPSKTDKKSLNKTFKKLQNWCDNKMDEVLN